MDGYDTAIAERGESSARIVMPQSRYSRVRTAFLRARELSENEREVFLAGLSGTVRIEVSDLLARDGSTLFDLAVRHGPNPVQGAIVAGYRLLHTLGTGGMGQVWEALHDARGDRVAVKLILLGGARGRTEEFFAREARAGMRVDHPNAIRTLGFGEDEHFAWIVQELVPGGRTLQDELDELRTSGGVPEQHDRRAAEVIAQVADALQAAHAVEVLHRDIKPRNILLTPEGRPKVADFGLARILDESALSRTGELAGTYHYMSPEQVTARRVGIDHRTDIFSLGVVLYELLTLRRPFDGETAHQVCNRIVFADPVPLCSIRPSVPRGISWIVAKAVEKRPADRYSSMSEFANDLRRFLSGDVVQARPPGTWKRVGRLFRRSPAKAAWSVFAVASTVLLTILALRWPPTSSAEGRLVNVAAIEAARKTAESSIDYQTRDPELAASLLWASYALNEFGGGGALDAVDGALRRLNEFSPASRAVPLRDGASPINIGTDTNSSVLAVCQLHTDARTIESNLNSPRGLIGTEGSIRVWKDAHDLNSWSDLECPSFPFWCGFDSSGKRLFAALATGALRCWDLDDTSKPRDIPAADVLFASDPALASDVPRIAFCTSGGEVKVLSTIDLDGEPTVLDGLREPVVGLEHNALRFSADGRILVQSAESNGLRAWELGPHPTAVQLAIEGRRAQAYYTYFDRDDRAFLVTNSRKTSEAFEWPDGIRGMQRKRTIGKKRAEGACVLAFDRRLGIVAGAKPTSSTVRVWHEDDLTAELARVRSNVGSVFQVGFVGETGFLAAMSLRDVQLVDLRFEPWQLPPIAVQDIGRLYDLPEAALKNLEDTDLVVPGVQALAVSEHIVAVGSGVVRLQTEPVGLWRPTETVLFFERDRGDRVIGRWFVDHASIGDLTSRESGVRDVVFSPDGASAFVASQGGLHQVASAIPGAAQRELPGHEGAVTAVAWTSVGLVSGGEDGRVLLTPSPSGGGSVPVELWRSRSRISDVCHARNRLVAADSGGTLRVWPRIDDSRDESSDLVTDDSPILAAAIDESARWIAVASENSALRLWQLDATGRVHEEPIVHHMDQPVVSMDFDPSHPHLAIGLAEDEFSLAAGRGVVAILRLDRPTDRPFTIWEGEGAVQVLRYDPQGRVLFAGTRTGEVLRLPASAEVLAEGLARRGSRPLTREEWSRFVGPDLPIETLER